jgi:hypothetical protein
MEIFNFNVLCKNVCRWRKNGSPCAVNALWHVLILKMNNGAPNNEALLRQIRGLLENSFNSFLLGFVALISP